MLTLLVNSKIWSLFLLCCHLFPALWDPIIPAAAVVLSPRSALPTQDSEVNTAHLFIPYCLINTFLLEIFICFFFFPVLFLYQHAHCSEFFHNFLYSCHGGSGISASFNMSHSTCCGRGAWSEAMSHAVWGHPRWMGHCGEFWQKVIHWRREWQTTPVYLPWGPHELYKRPKIS